MNPTLMMIGEVFPVILSCITAVFGTVCLVGALEGFFLMKFHTISRIFLGAAAFLTLMPGWQTDAVGVVLAAAAYAVSKWKVKGKGITPA